MVSVNRTIREPGYYHRVKRVDAEGDEVLDWNEGHYYNYTIKGAVTFSFANPIEGQRLMVVVQVDESVPGTVKLTFPDSTWTERGPVFNIQPGLIGIYEFEVVDNNVVLVNSKQVS